MEDSDGPVGSRTDSLFKVVGVLEKAGVEFLNGGQPGVRMRPPQREAGPGRGQSPQAKER